MQTSRLTRIIGIAAILAVLVLLRAGQSSGQAVLPTPGPGTGIVTVTGTVDIGNKPSVLAAQEGEWRVALAREADVRITNTPRFDAVSLSFLRVGARYSVTWPSGSTEVIQVAQLGSGGWTRVETSGRRRWVNLGNAQSVEEM